MEKTIKYLENGVYHYATVRDVGDLAKLKTDSKDDLVAAINELFVTGGQGTAVLPDDYKKLVDQVADNVEKQQDIEKQVSDVDSTSKETAEELAKAKQELLDNYKKLEKMSNDLQVQADDLAKQTETISQDTEKKFSEVHEEANQTRKELNDKANNLEKELLGTKGDLEATRTELLNNTSELGKVKTQITKVDDQLGQKVSKDELDSVRDTLRHTQTDVEQTKDELKSKASQSSVDLVTNSVENLSAQVEQNSKGIAVTVKKDELAGNVANLLQNKTNLLSGTRDFSGTQWGNKDHWTEETDYWRGMKVYSSVEPSNGLSYAYMVMKGEQYTFSFYARQQQPNNKAIILLSNEDNDDHITTPYVQNKVMIGTSWAQYHLTFQAINDGQIVPRVEQFVTDNKLYVAGYKLELGNVATPWEPSEDDIVENIKHNENQFKIQNDKIESVTKQQQVIGNKQSDLETKVTQNAEGILQTSKNLENLDGKITAFNGKLTSTAKELTASFEETTNRAIGQISDSPLNLIRNGAFDNTGDSLAFWQNISDKATVRTDEDGLHWLELCQTDKAVVNPIGATSNYFDIKQGKVTIAFDVRGGQKAKLDDQSILLIEVYDDQLKRVEFKGVSLDELGLSLAEIKDGKVHRGMYRYPIDRLDAKKMTIKPVVNMNGDVYFTNFSSRLSSIDGGQYTPNPKDIDQQIVNQNTKIEQNAKEIGLKANSNDVTSAIKKSEDAMLQVASDKIDASVKDVESRIDDKVNKKTTEAKEAAIKVASDQITASVNDVEHKFDDQLDKKTSEMKQAAIKVASDQIAATVKDVESQIDQKTEAAKETAIKTSADQIKASAKEVESKLDEQLGQKTDEIKQAAIDATADKIKIEIEDSSRKFNEKLKKTSQEIKTASEEFTNDGISQVVRKVNETEDKLRKETSASIKNLGDKLSTEVSDNTKDTKTLIEQTANDINQTISSNQKNTETRFQQTDTKLAATVTKDDIKTGFNISNGKINLMGKELALTGDMIASGGPYKHEHVGYMGQKTGGWSSTENWEINGEKFHFTSEDDPIPSNRFTYTRFLVDEIVGLKTYKPSSLTKMEPPHTPESFLEAKGNHLYSFIDRKDVPEDAPDHAGALKISAIGSGDKSNYFGLKYLFWNYLEHITTHKPTLVPMNNALYIEDNGKRLYGEQKVVVGIDKETHKEIEHWYYFDKADRDGAAAMDKFVTLPDGREIHYDENGIMDKGEFRIGADYYYGDLGDGHIHKNEIGLIPEKHQLHYYGSDGKRVTGTIKLFDTQYTFDESSGALVMDGDEPKEFVIGKNWYYMLLPKVGYIAVGWQHLVNDGMKRILYYDENTGAMVHGWHTIDGHSYNFGANGAVVDENSQIDYNYQSEKKKQDTTPDIGQTGVVYSNDLIEEEDQTKLKFTYGENVSNQRGNGEKDNDNRLSWKFKNGSLKNSGIKPNKKYLLTFSWHMDTNGDYAGKFTPQMTNTPWDFDSYDKDPTEYLSISNHQGIYRRIVSISKDHIKEGVTAESMEIRLDYLTGKLNICDFHIVPLEENVVNSDVSISFYAKSLNGNTQLHVYDATESCVRLTNTWKRYEVHTKCQDAANAVRFYLEEAGTFELSMPKYELGTIATSWVDGGVGAKTQYRESTISPFDGIIAKWGIGESDSSEISLRPDTGLVASEKSTTRGFDDATTAQLHPAGLHFKMGQNVRSMNYSAEGFTYIGRDGQALDVNMPYMHSITDINTQFGGVYDFISSQNTRVNLIRNSNFDCGTDEWNLGKGAWAGCNDFVDGSPFLRMSVDTNTDVFAWQDAKWRPDPGLPLMILVKARKEIAGHIDFGNAGVKMDFGNGGSMFFSPEWDTIKFGQWTQLAWGPVKVPNNTSHFHPNLYLLNKGGSSWVRIAFTQFCIYPGIDIRPYTKG